MNTRNPNPLWRRTSRWRNGLLGLAAALFMAPVADAQVNLYSFAVGSDPYVALSGATTFSISGGGGTADDGYSALQPIGFTFNFGGTGFTQFSMHSNGWLRLGATASATDYTPMDNTTMNNLIVFNGRDLNNSGAVYSYLLEGTAGNYICKIQANNFYRYNTTSHLGNAQIWLYEATGVVEIRYGTYATTWTSGTCQVGIRTTNADIKKVVSTTWAGVTAGSTDGVANTAGITQATTNQVVSGTLFSFTPPSPCTGTPAPGATTGPASVGSGETVNLGLQNTTPGTGVTYQWYVSTVSSGGPWTAGGTNATYSPTQTVQSWYYCDVTCGANTGSSTVHQVDISYCTSTSTSQASYFSNFATTGGLTNITNASGASAGGYGDFTAQSVSQSANSSVNFTTGLVGTTVGVAIWVDWNNDLVFDDILSPAGEKMYNTGAYVSSASGSFTVPAATPAGNYRMRIRMDWNAQNPTPCGNISRGETEDYTFTVAPPPACPAPSALSAINATSSGADLGWTENGSATAWDLEIGTTGFTPTGTPTVNDAGANPYTWSGGAPATTYQFYVRADCGMDNVDVSAWMGPFSFTTSCTVLTVPYTQDFEGTTGTSLPTCWSLENVNGGTTWLTAAYTGFGSTRAAKYGYDGTLPGNDWLYSPGLALTGGTSYTVEYSMVDPSTSFPEAMDVFWGSAAAAGSMTNLIADHTPVPVTTPVTVSYAFTPGSSGTYYIGWHSKSGADEFDFYLDDISVVVTPSCLAPSALGATSITAAGADLGWTENGTATAWDLEIGTNGFTPTGTPTLNDVGANPYTWAGGAANTAYDFYVRADCGMDNVDVSTWEGPYSFTTLCTSFAAPFHEGFDVSSTTPPTCWSISAGAGSGWEFDGPTDWNITCGTPGNGSTGTGSFALIDYSTPTEVNVVLNAPLVDVSALTNPQLRFDRYMCATSNAPNPLYVEYYDGAVWQLLQSFTTGTATTGSNAAGWQEEIVNLSAAVSGGIVQIRFRGEDGGGPSSFQGDMGLDEIYFEEAPACPAPNALSATNVTASGADLGWMENGSATAWDLEIGATGFTPTGTPTVNDVGTNPYTWSGGAAATTYQFYVRADCGMDNVDVSSWTGPFTFTTLCDAFAVPYTEDFEGTTGTDMPLCWSIEDVNGGETWESAATTTLGGARAARYSYDVSLPGDDWLYSPGLALTGGTSYTVEYSMVDPSGSFPEAMDVFWGAAAASGSMTNLIADHTPVPGTATTVSYTFTPGSSGTYYIGWHAKSGADEFLFYLDDISVVEAPPCPDPTGVSVSGTTATGTNVNFTCSGCTGSVIVEFGVSPHTPGAAGTAGAGGTLVTGAVSPQAISLSPSTTYQIFVRQDCSLAMDGFSDNTAPVSVTTPALPPANDLCADAIAVGCNSVTSGSTVNSTTTGNPGTCTTGLNAAGGVWYTVTGWGGNMIASLCDAPYDSKIGIFTGSCGALTCVIGEDDDFTNCGGNDPYVNWASTNGTTYYIYVTGFSANTGTFDLTVSCGDLNPACTENGLNLEFQSDVAPAGVTWEVLDESGAVTVLSGNNPIPASSIGTQSLCLPDGCYRLRVTDGAGDGITGYELRESGANGRRIIDNTDNMITGASQIANGGTFCLPMGDIDLIYSSCDKLDWVSNKYLVCHADPAVSAIWVPGGPNNVQNGGTGYAFWIFDPNGTYSFRRFRSHRVSDGFSPASPTRACHLKVNGWNNTALTPHIPEGVLMNVRVRPVVTGTLGEWGATCTMKMDAARAACPLVNLQDDPANTSDYSCGVTRNFGGPNASANKIVAKPAQAVPAASSGNVRYQFRFNNGEGCKVLPPRTSPTLYLNWNASVADPLTASATYDVDVRVSLDGGATWCTGPAASDAGSACGDLTPWGKVCSVTIGSVIMIDGESSSIATQGDGALTMYPNPNNGELLFISLTELAPEVNTVSVDIYDLTGKRITARTIAVQDGFLNTAFSLNGDVASGLYMVNITAGDKTYTERLVIQK